MTLLDEILEIGAKELSCSKDELMADEIEQEFFSEWSFWNVSDYALPPASLVLAAREAQVVRVLKEDGFAPLVPYEPIEIRGNEEAVRYVEFFIWLTDASIEILNSTEDVPGITEQEIADLSHEINSPSADFQEECLIVQLFAWKATNIYKMEFLISDVGAIQYETKKIKSGVGVALVID